MRPPLCGEELKARYTRQGKTYKVGLMLACPGDSRHFRRFVNDPIFLRDAESLADPDAFLAVKDRKFDGFEG